MEIFGHMEEILFVLVMLAVVAFVLAMFVHMLNNKRFGLMGKVLWAVGIFVFFPLGALYYFYWADLYHRRNWRPELPKS